VEEGYYIKGMHNLLSIHFLLGNSRQFDKTMKTFENFSNSHHLTDNARMQAFVYLNTAKINKHFLEGTFSEGLKLVPEIDSGLKKYALQLDAHRVLIFYYKIASLYFGAGNSEKATFYLNKIINWKVDLRRDLQCYARLLNLITHYELGHYDLTEYLLKSVYRFMAKMGNLSVAEEEIFGFLKDAFNIRPDDTRRMKAAFENLLEKLRREELNKYEKRAFMYLDIISWLESKIQGVPVQNVIRNKFLKKNEPQRIENIPAS